MTIQPFIDDMPPKAQAIAHYIVKLENMRKEDPTPDNDLLHDAIVEAYTELQRVLG